MKVRIQSTFFSAAYLRLRPASTLFSALLQVLLLAAATNRHIGAQTAADTARAANIPSAPATAASEAASNLTVYLLTFAWGDVVWERFGHNAIWIRDRANGTDLTYNWGMFDFNQ